MVLLFLIIGGTLLVWLGTGGPQARQVGMLAAIVLGLLGPLAVTAHDAFDAVITNEGTSTQPSSSGVSLAVAAFGLLFTLVVTGFARCRHLDVHRRRLAWLAVTAGYLALLAAAFRHSRLDHETYRFGLPVVAELRPGESVEIDHATFRLSEECRLTVIGRIGASRALPKMGRGYRGLASAPDAGAASCAPVRIRRDARSAVAVVEALPIPAMSDLSWSLEGAYSTTDGHRVGLDTQTLAPALRPPISWTIGAALSVVVALGFLAAARLLRQRGEVAEAHFPAIHHGDGWFELADGRRLRERDASSVPVGEVTVGILEPVVNDAYRAPAMPRLVRAWSGNRHAIATRLRDYAASCEGVALAVVAIGTTPLVTALVALQAN